MSLLECVMCGSPWSEHSSAGCPAVPTVTLSADVLKIAELERRVADAEVQLAAKDARIAELLAYTDRAVGDAYSKCSAAQGATLEAMDKRRELEARVAELKSTLASLDGDCQTCRRLNERVAELEAKLAAMEQESAQWKRLYSENVDVAAELFQGGGRYRYLLNVGDNCTTDGVRALAALCDRLKERIAELRHTIEGLTAKSEIDERQCDEMTDTAGRLAVEVEQLRARLAAWEPVVKAAIRLGMVAAHAAERNDDDGTE